MKTEERKLIKRQITDELRKAASEAPVVAVFGPRQSGKTTLVRSTFANYKYFDLEDWDLRRLALEDTRAFFSSLAGEGGVILDEIQNVPQLLSYIKVKVDENRLPGSFILTGSQNLLLNQSITQSLAGRVAILTLLPLSIPELKREAKLLPRNALDTMLRGFYPQVVTAADDPEQQERWYKNYITTYLERDVRQLKNIPDLSLFKKFVGLCAGRIGQLLNISSLANDCDVSVNTAQGWLSVLEATYIIFLTRQYHRNFNKRLVKAPKLYFYDTGLACSLLGIDRKEELFGYRDRGSIFESMVLSEFMKHYYNEDKNPRVSFWRDYSGHEIDCILEQGGKISAIEIKAGMTISKDYFKGLRFWGDLTGFPPENSFLIYSGYEDWKIKGINVLGWRNMDRIFELIGSGSNTGKGNSQQ